MKASKVSLCLEPAAKKDPEMHPCKFSYLCFGAFFLNLNFFSSVGNNDKKQGIQFYLMRKWDNMN